MRLLNLLLVFGHIFATGKAGAPEKYLPKNDPSISHLLLHDPTQVDRLAVYATVMHEFKRDGKKVSKAFKAEFERIKAERAARKSPLQKGISGTERKGARRAANPRKPPSANSRVKNGRSAPRAFISFTPAKPGHQRTNQPFQPMSQPASLGQWNRSRPLAMSQPSPFQGPSTAGTSVPSYGSTGNLSGSRGLNGSMDSEAAFILSNFTETFRDTIYRFEERRRRIGGSAPRPAPVPAQTPAVSAVPPRPKSVARHFRAPRRKAPAQKPSSKTRTPMRRPRPATAKTTVQARPTGPKATTVSTRARMLNFMKMRRGAPKPKSKPPTPPSTPMTPPDQVEPAQEEPTQAEEADEEQD